MEVISHRGLWYNQEEKNTLKSFKKSFDNNFGLETDIRDMNKELVICHDLPDESSIKLTHFFSLYKEYNEPFILALNIKADGLQNDLFRLIKKYEISNYFFFDMSVPDTIGYLKMNLKFFTRQSEYENNPSFYEECSGIWIDSFKSIWYSEDLIKSYLSDGKKVVLVSSELHKREYLTQWNFIKNWDIINNDNLILCTDFPEKAIKFFKNE